jgi:uncharacterized metal-binding protein
MPSSHTHEKWALLLAVPLSYIFFKISGKILDSIIFFLSFIFGVFMLSPDLDTKSKIHSRWGFLRFIWFPYRKIVKHRSIISHFPILGSIIRTLYLIVSLTILSSIIIYVIFTAVGIKNQGNIISAMKNSLILIAKIISDMKINLIIAIVLGISAGDLIHYLLDVFTSYIKKQKVRK